MKDAAFRLRTSIALCALFAFSLSLASAYRTGVGLTVYTVDPISSVFMTVGVQGLMLAMAYIISQLRELFTTVFWIVFSTYLMCMGISVFFSFASFFENVQTEEASRSEATIVLQSEWNTISSQINRVHRDRLVLEANDLVQTQRFSTWSTSFREYWTEVELFERSARSIFAELNAKISETESERAASKDKIEQDVLEWERELRFLRRDRDDLSQRISSQAGQVRSVEVELDAKRRQAEAELKQGGTSSPDNDAISPPGDGPIYRGFLAEAAEINQRRVQLEAVLQGLQAERGEIDLLLNDLEQRLSAATQSLAILRGSRDLSQLTEAEKSQLPYQDALTDISRILGNNPLERLGRPISVPQDGLDLQVSIAKIVEICADLTAQVEILGRGLATVDLGGGLARPAPNSISCSFDPSISIDGRTLKSQVENLTVFQDSCGQDDFPTGYSTGLFFERLKAEDSFEFREFTALANLNDATWDDISNFYQTNREQFEEILYRLEFREIIDHVSECLQTTDLTDEELNDAKIDMQDWLLSYNPDAHSFTRALASFKVNNDTAYLAGAAALSLDILILLSGFVGYRVRRLIAAEPAGNTLSSQQDEIISELADEDLPTLLDIVRSSKTITKTSASGTPEVWFKFANSALKSPKKSESLARLERNDLIFPVGSRSTSYELASETLREMERQLSDRGFT